MKDVDRREFFKKCYKIGGYAAIAGMGFSAVKEAMAHGILPAVVGTSTGTLYSAWDETTETVKNSAVWLLEGGAAANETGVDSRTVPLTGVDLVGTQAGALAAASGSPPSRLFDGTDDLITFTANATDVIANGTSVWSLVIKVENLADWQVGGGDPVFYFFKAAYASLLGLYDVGGSTFQIWDAGGQRINSATTAPIPTAGMVHIAAWSDGTYVRCGWVAAAAGSGANGQPTKWSNFPANNRLSYTGQVSWPNSDFNTGRDLMRQGSRYSPGKLYYALMSDTCLIDNAA